MGRAKDTARIISRITGEITVTALDLVVLAAALRGGFFVSVPRGEKI